MIRTKQNSLGIAGLALIEVVKIHSQDLLFFFTIFLSRNLSEILDESLLIDFGLKNKVPSEAQ